MVTVDTGTLINARQTEAADTAALAGSFLAQLLETTNVAFGDGFNIDNLLPNSYNYASVPSVYIPLLATGIRPDVSSLDVTGPPAAPEFSFTPLVAIALPADDLVTPTAVFAYAEGTYDRALLDPWRAKLLADLEDGGYGIDTNDEIALLNRARDREVEATMTRVEGVGRDMAARGFPLPPGEMAVHIDRAWQDMQDKVSSMNREIYIDRAKRFVDNRQFTIVQVKEMEQILIGFYNAVQERALNVARYTVELAIALFNSQIARFKVRLEAAIAAGTVQYQRAQSEEAQARAYFEVFRSQIMAYEANLRRVIDTAKVQVEAYAVDVQLDRVYNDGQIATAQLQQKVLEATVQQNIQIDQVAVENAKAKLLAAVEALKFRAGASQYASEKFFAVLTAIESSVNTLAVQTATG